MPGIVDVTADSDEDVKEIAHIIDDSEDDIVEVPAGGPPLWFHGYRRGRELGRGASGQVFLCRKQGVSSGFAVKLVDLRRIRLRQDPEREHRKLRRELEILKTLPAHQNIVQMVDAFEEGDWFFLVLELVGGGDLFTVLTSRSQSRLQDREAAFVAQQLLSGLAFLHGRGVLHRDLKLENVLVASERQARPLVFYTVKITDFGLSKAVGAGLSEARSRVGTRPYIAPEVMHEGLQDFSSDLWCLGILLYVLLNGHFPFDRLLEHQADLDKITMGSKVCCDAAKSILHGLLQLEPAHRLTLEAVQSHEWCHGDGWVDGLERSGKRKYASWTSGEHEAGEQQRRQHAFKEPRPCSLEIAKESTPDIMALPTLPTTSSDEAAVVKQVLKEQQEVTNQVHIGAVPKGTWTPYAVETTVSLRGILPVRRPDELQVHVFVPEVFAGSILGKSGARIQHIASTADCRVWMTKREGASDRRVGIIGTFRQCKVAQELVHERLAHASKADWRDTEAEVLLLVRSEAAGVITGKQGFVLNQIREQSKATIQLLRDQVEGQRPLKIAGTLQSILLAERHVFELVRAVPV
eukprot:CAMPEP_0172936012 /NCGR_PEP_ID=MMETSP1075-20121228/221803_1 /TAXON_ID=2916 /ORGANISM="Ceratium fusus, Strain PA161109" /LENGTH=577 /DNA_ID=CAMNT_0013797379 /DNA_START=150 /DNA_END=1880 /DNA_ORIENTATION=-